MYYIKFKFYNFIYVFATKNNFYNILEYKRKVGMRDKSLDKLTKKRKRKKNNIIKKANGYAWMFAIPILLNIM